MAYKQKSSPFNKSKERVVQDYSRNAISDFEHGENKEGDYEKKEALEVGAGESPEHYNTPLSFMSKHSNSGRNSGSPLHDDYFIGESPEEIAKADKWRKDNPVDWDKKPTLSSDFNESIETETENLLTDNPVDKTATGSGAAHEAKWKSANTASGNDLNTQVGIRNKSAKGTEAYVGSQNKINKYLGNKTVHTFSPKKEAKKLLDDAPIDDGRMGNVTGGGRPTFTGSSTSTDTSGQLNKNIVNTSITGKPQAKGGKPTFTGQGTSTRVGTSAIGDIASISTTEKQSGKQRRKSRKAAISSTMETSGYTKRQATRSVKSSSAADKYKFSGKERFAGRALRKSNRLAKDDIGVGGLKNKLKGSKKLNKK